LKLGFVEKVFTVEASEEILCRYGALLIVGLPRSCNAIAIAIVTSRTRHDVFDNEVVLVELLERVKAFVILAFQYQKTIRWIAEEIQFLNVNLALLGRRRDESLNLGWKI
jgi:hypothetical protein